MAGLGHGFLRQFGALLFDGTRVEHGRQERPGAWRDGGLGAAGARLSRWRRWVRGWAGEAVLGKEETCGCPGSAPMRQTGLFCERRMFGSSQPPRSEDEADIRADQEGTC